MKPEYIIERYKHGWLLRGTDTRPGIPMDALTECLAMMPKDSVIDGGISTALGGVCAVGTSENCDKWRAEIEDELQKSSWHPEMKWLLGTDTGLSSKCIFAALARPDNKTAIDRDIRKVAHLPHDSDDFGRCLRLVQRFMWRKRLDELVVARPEWSLIVSRWDELAALHEASNHQQVTAIIREIRK